MRDDRCSDGDSLTELERLRLRVAELESAQTKQHDIEQASRESAELLREALENTPIGIWSADADYRIQVWNAAMESMSGIRRDEVLGAHVLERFPSLAASGLDRVYRRVVETGEPIRLDDFAFHDETLPRPELILNLKANPLRHPDGSIRGLIVAVEDVTERRQTEQSLAETERFIQAVADSMPSVLYVYDLKEGRNVYVNRRIEHLLGYSSEQIRAFGSNLGAQLFHPDDRERFPETIARLSEAADGQIDQRIYRVRHANGQWRWFSDHSVVFSRDSDGSVRQILGVNQDITQQKEAEERLKQSEHYHRLLAENTSDCIWQMNVDGTYAYVNPAIERLLGYTVEEFLKTRMADHFDAEEMQRADARIAEYASRRDEEGSLYEAEMFHKAGHRIPVEILATPVYDEGDTLVAFHGVARNITDRKRAEQERRDLEAQIQHTQKLESLGVLAGGIAHDFNNLLMGILGNADLALSNLSPVSPIRENIEEIKRTSSRAADLCKQMLAYSGRGRFVVRPLNLSEVVDEMAHMLEVTISKKAVLKYAFADNLPCIEADATQMRQVIMNLISNASEAIGDRSGIISVSTGSMVCDRAYLADTYVDEELPEGRYVYLEVADTGCGMTEEVKQRIFDPFYTTKFTGRGLGLAAVLGIIRGHQGALKVYSEPGRGTTVKVLVPVCDATAQPETVPAPSTDIVIGTGTVLLVDDEDIVRSVGKRMLQKMAFEVLTAGDGAEAIELYGKHRDEIRCVVLDLTMPHMDGEETYRELRRINPGVRVILSSGYNEQEVTQRFVGKGLAGFVQKPYQMASLSEALRKIFSQSPGGS